MTTKTDHYRPEFIESFPDSMDPGVLYISIEYGTCGHLCACGCGHEVITPLGPAQWLFSYDGKNVSLRPSIGNWSLPCKSHYIVDRGGVVRWARTFTDREIVRNRDLDRAVLSRGDDDRTYDPWLPAGRDADERERAADGDGQGDQPFQDTFENVSDEDPPLTALDTHARFNVNLNCCVPSLRTRSPAWTI